MQTSPVYIRPALCLRRDLTWFAILGLTYCVDSAKFCLTEFVCVLCCEKNDHSVLTASLVNLASPHSGLLYLLKTFG